MNSDKCRNLIKKIEELKHVNGNVPHTFDLPDNKEDVDQNLKLMIQSLKVNGFYIIKNAASPESFKLARQAVCGALKKDMLPYLKNELGKDTMYLELLH